MKKILNLKTIVIVLLLAVGVASVSYYVVNKASHEKVLKAEPAGN